MLAQCELDPQALEQVLAEYWEWYAEPEGPDPTPTEEGPTHEKDCMVWFVEKLIMPTHLQPCSLASICPAYSLSRRREQPLRILGAVLMILVS